RAGEQRGRGAVPVGLHDQHTLALGGADLRDRRGVHTDDRGAGRDGVRDQQRDGLRGGVDQVTLPARTQDEASPQGCRRTEGGESSQGPTSPVLSRRADALNAKGVWGERWLLLIQFPSLCL